MEDDAKKLLKKVLIAQVEHYRQIYNDHGRWPRFDEKITYKWDLRGAVAGQAISHDGKYIIRFNLDIADSNIETYLRTTVPHEFAHLVLDHYYPWAPSHGNHWRICMSILGAPANRCHSYSYTPYRVVTRYPYMCSCMIHSVSAITHNRVQAGKQRRECVHCGEVLVYSPELED